MSKPLSAIAATTALMIHAMQKPEEQVAKRKLFEDAAYEHYVERGAPGGLTQEEFCGRNPESLEHYFYSDLNNAWWGFQAGFMAAALQGK